MMMAWCCWSFVEGVADLSVYDVYLLLDVVDVLGPAIVLEFVDLSERVGVVVLDALELVGFVDFAIVSECVDVFEIDVVSEFVDASEVVHTSRVVDESEQVVSEFAT